MRWIVSLPVALTAVLMACGGPQIPTHNGYKPKEAQPWKKAKVLKLDDKLEAKTDGDVSYPEMRRARWFQLQLPSTGQLSLALEITPPGDAVNDDFDLAMEVLDPSFRVISKSDLEDEDAHELNKKKTLVDLAAGKYLIHLYLQGRMDSADFVLRATFKPTAGSDTGRSNFPAEVPFTPTLAVVPLQDDTPRNYKPTTTVVTVTKQPRAAKPAKPAAPPAETVTARIIAIQVVAEGTKITIGRGTDFGAHDGMSATLGGIGKTVQIGNCNERTCTAVVKGATPDQVKSANGVVTLAP
jgi:hypothetical protein